jgi:hypothetical protein
MLSPRVKNVLVLAVRRIDTDSKFVSNRKVQEGDKELQESKFIKPKIPKF